MKWIKDEYYRNVICNYVFRIVGMLLSVISVRVSLDYLGTTLYGLWVTIASVISWMSSGDFGIGNGLRNELAKAFAQNDAEKQKKLIAVAFGSMQKVVLLLLCIMALLCESFIYLGLLEKILRVPMYITGVFFCANLCLGIVDSVAYSYQRSWLVSLKTCMISMCSIAIINVLARSETDANLSVFALANGACTMIPNLILIWILKRQNIRILYFGNNTKEETTLRKSIMSTGLQFFGLQICAVVLYSTDNLIINYCLTSDLVTKYAAITKVYDIGSSLFSILLVALWSAVTLHLAQNDYGWVRKKIKELLLVWSLFSIGVVGVSLLFNPIVELWLGENAFYYEPSIISLFALYCVTTTFSSIFVNVLNGAGVVKLQLGLAIVGAIINIPLSVYFSTNLDMGILGVKLATYISAAMTAVVMPIQVLIYIHKGVNDENSSCCQ